MAPHLIPSHARDDNGFERLYRAHVEHIHRYALAITGNRSDAEDVTQTTFMNAYRAYERGDRPRAAQNWLMTIAHNVCRQRARNSARRPREVEFSDELAEAHAFGSDAPTAADIRRAVRHLPPDERTAIAMRELQGRTNGEIADVLGLTGAATERLLFRARRSLREQLTETLTCFEAEAAINRKLDGESVRPENAALRRHLRECAQCAHLARTYRAQRSLLRRIGTATFPTSLLPASGIGTKVAMVVAAAAVSGGGYEAARHTVLAPTIGRLPVRAQPTVHATQPAPARTRVPRSTSRRPVLPARPHATTSHAATPSTTRPASPAAAASVAPTPPTPFHEPTPAAPPAADADAGGGTGSAPAAPSVDAPTTGPPSISPPAAEPPTVTGTVVAAEHDPGPPPAADAAQSHLPADPGSQADAHRSTSEPPAHP